MEVFNFYYENRYITQLKNLSTKCNSLNSLTCYARMMDLLSEAKYFQELETKTTKNPSDSWRCYFSSLSSLQLKIRISIPSPMILYGKLLMALKVLANWLQNKICLLLLLF